jgi:hypothetical protein
MMVKEIICIVKGTTQTTVFLGGKSIKQNAEYSRTNGYLWTLIFRRGIEF